MDLVSLCQNAKNAKYGMGSLDTKAKNEALLVIAEELLKDEEAILKNNAIDLENAEKAGMSAGLVDRLRLTHDRIEGIAEGVRQVAALPDPVGELLEEFERPNGLHIRKVRVPLGVVGIIYESRPNVTVDAFALCFKAGNAVILKGGSDALHSNIALVRSMRGALSKLGLNADCLQLIEDTDRAVTTQFMKMKEYIDVLIPRGGAGLIRAVVENASIPVIETGTGNCHIYVDATADVEKAIPIIINAKTQRIGVCNACESLVIHKDIREELLPRLAEELRGKNVEMRADEGCREFIADAAVATEEDYGREYLDLILSMKTVESVEEAICHINTYNTKHSECIITEDTDAAQKFLQLVDAACVYVNASTRFTDGFEFGFGAEIGISTQMLHARGPMGLRELNSYKYQIVGSGQVRG